MSENSKDISDDSGDEEITELLEEDGRSEPQKRPLTSGSGRQHKKKKGSKYDKDDLYKPPTAEEINNLNEAETLFQSSIFRMQIDELLKEIKLKEKWNKQIEPWLKSLKETLTSMPPTETYNITDQSWTSTKGIEVPIIQKPYEVKGFFKFWSPSDVRVVGSFLLGLTCAPDLTVDVAVEIPRECLHKTDFLNHRYHRKRALYLAHIASVLITSDLVEDLNFSYHHGNHMKPVLFIKPKGNPGKHFNVCLLPCPPKDFFKYVRFIPSRNNIRSSWYFGDDSQTDTSAPTPHYNSSILADMVMINHLEYLHEKFENSQSLRDGILLLKVWLHQRSLDKGFGGFSRFLLTMLVAHLLVTRKVTLLMSSYQVVRNTLLALTHIDWSEKGIAFTSNLEENQPTLDEFQKHFDVVFIDPTGWLNLMANVSKETVHRIQNEAKIGLTCMDSNLTCGFDALFMTPVHFYHSFDHIIHLNDVSQLRKAIKILNVESRVLDYCGNFVAVIMPYVGELLKKGLGKRLHVLDVQHQDCAKWSVKTPPPGFCNTSTVTIGINVNSQFSTSAVDRGPEADAPEAEEFRTFWGDKSELRRFQDGSIVETVVWPGKNLAEKRMAISHIVKYILERHVSIDTSTVSCLGSELDSLLNIPHLEIPSEWPPYGTADEVHIEVQQSLTDLSKMLRKLENFPLAIKSVQGISSVFRFCEVFPPLPTTCSKSKDSSQGNCKVLEENVDILPKWVQPLNVVIYLEDSGKWPDDLQAFKFVKAAFHAKLAELLRAQFALISQPFPEYVDVMKNGYIFRLQIACQKEIMLLKQVKTPEGMLKIKDTDEARTVDYISVIMPKFTSTLHGLYQQHNSFGVACRLAKRWIASQLLDSYITEPAIELIVAYIYISPEPYIFPSCPQTAFLRFLHIVSKHDWRTQPLIVNLNNELKRENYAEIQSTFTSQRHTLPAMYIATPIDQGSSPWTRKTPSAQILYRLVTLAKAALSTLEEQLKDPSKADFKQIFRPPLDVYDVIIHLQPLHVTKHYLAVDVCKHVRPPSYNAFVPKRGSKLPVIGFDPVQCYLQELRDCFDEFCLFFYDGFGGDYIAVLWKPHAFEPHPFKVSHTNGRTIQGTSGKNSINIVPNVEAILEDFAVLGTGLVKSVELKSEKWVI